MLYLLLAAITEIAALYHGHTQKNNTVVISHFDAR